MESINVSELVERLGSDEDAVRKMAVFKLQSNIGDPSFADVFILEGGLNKLRYLTLRATGNTLAYSLTSFSRLLEVDKGWEYVNQDLIERVRLLYCCVRARLRCLKGCGIGCHPSTRQYSPRSHVHSCLHRLPPIYSLEQDISTRFIRLSSAQACYSCLSSVSGNAGEKNFSLGPRSLCQCSATHKFHDARRHHE